MTFMKPIKCHSSRYSLCGPPGRSLQGEGRGLSRHGPEECLSNAQGPSARTALADASGSVPPSHFTDAEMAG